MEKSIKVCPNCGVIGSIKHMHDTAHGLEDTHMEGSERFECSSCGASLTREQAEGLGLKYVLDKEGS